MAVTWRFSKLHMQVRKPAIFLTFRQKTLSELRFKALNHSFKAHFSSLTDDQGKNTLDNANKYSPSSSEMLIDYVTQLEENQENADCAKGFSNDRSRPLHKKKVSSIFQSGRPHILGFSLEELKSRIEILEASGINGQDSLNIATAIPSHLDFSAHSFKDIIEILQDLKCNVAEIVIKAPFIFGMDSERLLNNVNRLRKVGIMSQVIGQAITHNAVIAVYPLTDNAVEVLRVLLTSCEFEDGVLEFVNENRHMSKEEFQLRLLIQPVDETREQAVLGENFQDLARFLRELQISPCLMVLNYPSFFSADIQKLNDALMFFTSRPLLFETEMIQKLMVTRTDVFVNFDREVYQQRVELLKGVLKTPRQLYMLLQKYFFFRGDMNLEKNIKILQSHGFESDHMAKILTTKDFFTNQEDKLDNKLQLLLSLDSVDHDAIANSSFSLSKPMEFLSHRIEFVKSMKPEMLNNTNLDILFGTDDDEFVHRCQSSLDKYLKNANPVILMKTKKRGPRAKKKITKE
ncbi:predicted protein [Nematostella vectensis]|uniref:Transcription termination factor 3, mitochondrial n=1 Tax=Nematostella vectensis TaxID=45351 RepID=A7RFS4_NEMVE|nr:predicted protein [Nematostella vectensis]|eukprot:XP_001641833.1 predicted protein [Nematostella vectensis]